MTGIELGAVVATYPRGQSVDVVLNTGLPLANVQVMVFTGSSDTGEVDLPDIGGPLDNTRWILTSTFERYVRGVIVFIHGVPMCIGFILPQQTQLTFDRKNFKVQRHASDYYETVSANADVEWSHPSGSYMRIAGDPGHADLAGADYDGLWAIKQNTASAPWFNLTVANAGAVVANVQISPTGDIVLKNNGNLTADVGGTATVNIIGTTTVNSQGAATLKAPTVKIDSPATTVTGTLLVEGALTFQSGMSGSAGSSGGSTMTIEGDAHYTGTVTADTDVLAAGKSGKGHIHDDPQGGQVGPPI